MGLSLLRAQDPLQPEKILKYHTRVTKAKVASANETGEKNVAARSKTLENFSRYRPTLQAELEYYTVGHDTVASLFDPSISDNLGSKEDASFFMAGIGDARHLLRTM